MQIKAREIISIGACVLYSMLFLFLFFVSLKWLLDTSRVDIAGLIDRSLRTIVLFLKICFYVQNLVPLEHALRIRVSLLALCV